MATYNVSATLTKEFAISVEADNENEAIEKLDEWIEDDFVGYQTYSRWDLEVA